MSINKFITRTAISLAAIGISALAALPAQAVLNEIVVTIQKRAENIQSVPVAVTAFSGDFLNETGFVDIFDLADFTPGLYFTTAQTATQSVIAIRGIGSSSNNLGFEPSVGVFIDGVYRSRTGASLNDLVDVERIEVARGPQGTLFGRNTSAGAVSIFTKAPEFEFGGFAEATVGNLHYRNLKGALTGPVVEDKVAARVSGFYTEREGYITNITDGSDINDRDRWGLRGNLLFTPNESLDIRLIVDYSEADEKCCSAMERFGGTSDTVAAVLGATIPAGVIPLDPTSKKVGFFNRQVAINDAPVSKAQDWGVSLEINWDLGGHTVTSITAYRDYEFFGDIDADFIDINVLPSNSRDVNQNAWTQEIRIANNDPGRFSYVAGAFYFTQNLDMVEKLRFGDASETFLVSTSGAALAPLAPFFDLFPDGGGGIDDHEQDHEAWAIFAQGAFDITNRLTFTGGVRFTKETKTLTSAFTEIPDGGVPIPPAFFPPFGFNSFFSFHAVAPIPDATASVKDEKFTGTAKLSYEVTPDIRTFISYSRGFKSGGTNVARIVPPAIGIPLGLVDLPFVFDAETVNSYEVGIKSELFENRLRLNIAGYYAEYNNFQDSTFLGTGFLVQNAGRVDAHGVEVEALAQPADWLTLDGNATYQKVEFGSFRSGPCPEAVLIPDGDRAGTCNITGNNVVNAPEWTLRAGAMVEKNFSSISAFLRGDVTYRSKQDTDATNDIFYKQTNFTLVNLRGGIRSPDGTWELTAWVDNLTKEEYIKLGFAGTLQNNKFAYPNEPRTYGLTVRTEF